MMSFRDPSPPHVSRSSSSSHRHQHEPLLHASPQRRNSQQQQHPPPQPPHHHHLSAADYIKLINIRSGKIVALCLVVSFGVYHGLLHLAYGVTPCKGLFNDGMFKGDELWQPWGCMMHKYTQTDAGRCFRYNGFYGRENHFVFVGDSRIRQIYLGMKSLLETGQEPSQEYPFLETKEASDNLSWKSEAQNLKLNFLWAPTVNSMIKITKDLRSKNDQSPSILVLGVSLQDIRDANHSSEAVENYKNNLTLLRPDLEYISQMMRAEVLWTQQPIVALDPKQKNPLITNGAIDRYNGAARFSLSKSSISFWSSLPSLGADGGLARDGIHLAPRALKQAIMMLLNRHCNDNMNFDDGTCCKSSNRMTNIQAVFLGFILVSFLVALVRGTQAILCQRNRQTHLGERYWKLSDHEDDEDEHAHNRRVLKGQHLTVARYIFTLLTDNVKKTDDESLSRFLGAVARLAIIIAYVYVCDRTNYFMKENKYYTPLNFFLPILYVIVVGLFFNEESKDGSFLNNDQTNEWKGWMQLVIMIYRMTGAVKIVPISMHAHVLISAYLFIEAYEHFMRAWTKSDVSWHTFMTVLFQRNFLTVVFCLAMNEPYQAYYFVPLLSYWYFVEYAILVIPPVVTAKSSEGPRYVSYFYMIVKLVSALGIITVFYLSEVFFEKVFLTRPWKALFVTSDDDITEWWLRWKRDRFTMLSGVTFGFLVALVRRHHQMALVLDDEGSRNGRTSVPPTAVISSWPSRPLGVLAAVGGLVGVTSYAVFAQYCGGRAECEEVHPYVVAIPIIGYIFIRCPFRFLRHRYSSFFAWFGRIGLEMFIAQHHIWLAADTHGILVLIPNYPVVNILLTSFIFVCAAHEINLITEDLAPFFVPHDRQKVLRNVAVLTLCLIPIGISDGMF